MFGMGASEILVILVVALLFLGPEKLPETAQKISKGIRDLRKQTRELQSTIENDSAIGGAIRDLKSALRGEEPRRTPPQVPKKDAAAPSPELSPAAQAALASPPMPEPGAAPGPPVPPSVPPPIPRPEPRLPDTAGEADEPIELTPDGDDDVAILRPATGTVAKGASES